ncbi:MAG TPA: hypothetical protein VJS43_14810 [Candidatus Acidoferrales bacterium]|nr:hypothetical protein [Candidatus Acidoferrales bacterium]
MPQEMESILRKSLDEVDRVQKWQITGLVIFLLFLVVHAFAFIGMVHGGAEAAPLTRRTVGMGILSVMFMVGVCTFGVTYFISRMTKRILRAIELSSRP